MPIAKEIGLKDFILKDRSTIEVKILKTIKYKCLKYFLYGISIIFSQI